jgi:ribosome maturation factor RimP
MLRQYKKNVGRTFTVKYRQDAEQKTLKGTLSALADDRLTFVGENGEPTTIEFSDIIESTEELPW